MTGFMPRAERPLQEGLEVAGVERVVLGVPSEGRDAVLPLLDMYAKLMR